MLARAGFWLDLTRCFVDVSETQKKGGNVDAAPVCFGRLYWCCSVRSAPLPLKINIYSVTTCTDKLGICASNKTGGKKPQTQTKAVSTYC